MKPAKTAKRTMNIGLAGYGMNYGERPFLYPGALPRPVLHTVCTSSPATAEAAAAEGGFTASTTDIHEMIANPEIDVINVSVPNHLHKPVILEALEGGKSVYCEKPLAGTIVDAREIAAAVAAAPRPRPLRHGVSVPLHPGDYEGPGNPECRTHRPMEAIYNSRNLMVRLN